MPPAEAEPLDDGQKGTLVEWIDLGAMAEWSYKPAADDLKEGNHTVDVRVYDGEKYSETATSYFTYKKSEEPGFGLLAALMAVLIAIPMARWRMRDRASRTRFPISCSIASPRWSLRAGLWDWGCTSAALPWRDGEAISGMRTAGRVVRASGSGSSGPRID